MTTGDVDDDVTPSPAATADEMVEDCPWTQ